jgi:hypothetical protein
VSKSVPSQVVVSARVISTRFPAWPPTVTSFTFVTGNASHDEKASTKPSTELVADLSTDPAAGLHGSTRTSPTTVNAIPQADPLAAPVSSLFTRIAWASEA